MLSDDLNSLKKVKEIFAHGDLIQKVAICRNIPIIVQEKGIEESVLSLIAVNIHPITLPLDSR